MAQEPVSNCLKEVVQAFGGHGLRQPMFKEKG